MFRTFDSFYDVSLPKDIHFKWRNSPNILQAFKIIQHGKKVDRVALKEHRQRHQRHVQSLQQRATGTGSSRRRQTSAGMSVDQQLVNMSKLDQLSIIQGHRTSSGTV